MLSSIIGRSCVVYLLVCVTAYYTLNIINNYEDYDGYSVVEVITKTEEETKDLYKIFSDVDIDIWKTSQKFEENHHVTVVVLSPLEKESILQQIDEKNYEKRILIRNVKETIDREKEAQKNYTKIDGSISFDHYYRYEDIEEYLTNLEKNYPNIVELINIGKSYEGRDMKMIKISKRENIREKENISKPIIFIDGGIHAREWIAPAQVLYIIHQLVENTKETFSLIENIDWYLIPVVNPDGYEFSHVHDRLWRRTRSPLSVGIPSFINNLSHKRGRAPSCVGVDANRNWDIYWNGFNKDSEKTNPTLSPGHIPCINDYAGPRPFSEIEVKNLADFAHTIKENIKLYITFHSFGNKILYPYGYTDNLPEDSKELRKLGIQVNASMDTPYEVGASANILYSLTGSSKDYFKDVLGVELSYTIELTDGSVHGFDLPPKDILPVVSDMFKGIKVFAGYIEQKF